MVLSEIPAGKPRPMALGGGDVGSRCVNVDFKLGEINPGGYKMRFLLRFIPNSNESVYGKERDLRNSCWTGKGLTVEVNGEGKRRVTWDCNKGGLKSFKWVTRGEKLVWGLGPNCGTCVGSPNLPILEFLGRIRFEVGESSSLVDPRPETHKAHDLVMVASSKT